MCNWTNRNLNYNPQEFSNSHYPLPHPHPKEASVTVVFGGMLIGWNGDQKRKLTQNKHSVGIPGLRNNKEKQNKTLMYGFAGFDM